MVAREECSLQPSASNSNKATGTPFERRRCNNKSVRVPPLIDLGATPIYVLIRLVRAHRHGPPLLGILHARPYCPYWVFLVRASCFVFARPLPCGVTSALKRAVRANARRQCARMRR